MRIIKFRGMDANGVMRHGQLSQDKPNSTVYYKEYSQRICWDNSNIPVSNESLGQFTGLLDKSGKEIYEGDILKHHFNNDGQYTLSKVVYGLSSDERGELRESLGFHRVGLKQNDLNCPTSMSYGHNTYEVIGDIYSNPELMEDK